MKTTTFVSMRDPRHGSSPWPAATWTHSPVYRPLPPCLATLVSAIVLAAPFAAPASLAVEYPGQAPGPAQVASEASQVTLSNRAVRAVWNASNGPPRLVRISTPAEPSAGAVAGGELFRVVLQDGRSVSSSEMEHTPVEVIRLTSDAKSPRAEDRFAGHRIAATFTSASPAFTVAWSAELRDGSNGVTMRAVLTAGADGLPLTEFIVLDACIPGAKVCGEVDGSPVVADRWFLACEHPLAINRVEGDRVTGGRSRPGLAAAQTVALDASVGITPPGQLRRAFLYHLERRRAHPYRPFLHYNSWYHLNIGRPDHRMTEAESLETIAFIGRELVRKRGVTLDAFVWDDGWDDFNSLWEFHHGFPNGFSATRKAGEAFGASQGVWISPWGGYGKPKALRLEHGKSQGYETNDRGFAMSGPKYRNAFRSVCLKMMRQYGVAFFKFDGMGAGCNVSGAQRELANDIDSVLALTGELRQQRPDLFISATVGTWPSPYWTFYADSIWRQGADTEFHGPGNGREQWITYRDMSACQRIVRRAPLYPLNSLMLHGPCIGDRANPSRMDRDEASVAHEMWTFFGSGTGLQELYISPHLLTGGMWDTLACAARWSRENADVLADAHWIGGDPGAGEVYGFASWSPRKGIVVLRNPSETPASYDLNLARDFELPREYLTDYQLESPRPGQRIGSLRMGANEQKRIELEPFEVLVFEATPVARP